MTPFIRCLALALALAGSTSSLHADANWLENGDFTDGTTHWRGNGRTPADYASGNPFEKQDGFTATGLIMELRGRDWDKIEQDFRGRQTHGILTITYKLSPDLAFSDKPQDYQNMPSKLRFDGWAPFKIPQNNWVVFIADSGSAHGTYWHIAPKMGSSEPQTVHLRVGGLTALENKTITIGFPPGTGKIVLLHIGISDQGGGEAPGL